jgi:hypothetical protein
MLNASFILHWWLAEGKRGGILKRIKEKNAGWLSVQDKGGIYSTRRIRYSNRRTFDSRAPTQVRHFVNLAMCVGYLDGQVNGSAFQRKIHRDMMAVQWWTCVADSSMCIEHIINLV